MKTLKYSEIHLLAAVWYIYACILQILDQNSKKNFAGCNGLKNLENKRNFSCEAGWGVVTNLLNIC